MNEKNYTENVEIPEGIIGTATDSHVTIKGSKGEVARDFIDPIIKVDVKEENFVISCTRATKREKTKIGTIKAHLRNMFKGVTEGHLYKLAICSGHFPMNVSVKGTQFVVNNFLGEKVPRVLNIKEGAKVTINGREIEVASTSKEIAGQVAADIEQLCRIVNRDRRIFQDGIYITNKDGKDI